MHARVSLPGEIILNFPLVLFCLKVHTYSWVDILKAVREGVKKKRIYLGLCPKHRTLPTHRARLGLH